MRCSSEKVAERAFSLYLTLVDLVLVEEGEVEVEELPLTTIELDAFAT